MRIISNISPLISLSLYNKDIYFNYPLCNTIYKINDLEITPELKLDFGSKNLSPETFENFNSITDIEKYINKNKGVNSLIYYAVSSPFSLFTFYDYQLNGYILLHNTNTNKTIIAHNIIDDLYFKGNKINLKPWKLPKLLKDSTIYYHIEPEELVDQFQKFQKRLKDSEWKSFYKTHSKFIETIHSIKEDDNPILLKIQLK